MKKNYLFLTLVFFVGNIFAQRDNSWQLLKDNQVITSEKVRETPYSQNQKLVAFNENLFKQLIINVADRNSGQTGVQIVLPNAKGEFEKFLIWESSNFEPELQAAFPEIRAFVGKGITDSAATLNLSFSPFGIQTMIFRAGTGTEFIEPYTKDRSIYIVFDSKTRFPNKLPLVCSTEDLSVVDGIENKTNGSLLRANNQVYKTMRLALSCTAEYTTYHGGTVAGALAAMNATMTRVNGVYEKDLALKLLIIANNSTVIYTNPTTDPYSTVTNNQAPSAWNTQLQNTLTSVIGEANYDIGHLFGASGGGGSAGCIGCVCVNGSKGSGITSPSDGIPMGDFFDIDYVAHEMGHQLGAEHTFSHGGISGFENNTVNVEPGSGSTIMAYAGIGGNGTDMQSNSDDYFTYRSILQIQTNLATKSCPISTNISVTNPKPNISIPATIYSIPTGTAFKLTGIATDNTTTGLTYCWEQNNDAVTISPTASLPSPTKTNGPNFRSLPPTSSPTRYLPSFDKVLLGELTSAWETVSSVARSLNFTLTVRDNVLNGGQTETASVGVSVINTGSTFSITSPSTENISWPTGSSQTVTWNVAGTNANGINTSNVNILFSSDGGQTFTTLVSNTPNDGSETITLPSTPAPYCRILVEAVDNIFYAVSKNIGLGYNFSTTCTTYSNNNPLPIPDGTGQNVPGSTVGKTINISETGIITDVNVTLSGVHPYFWDLNVGLLHPDETLILLLNRNCNQTSTGFNVLFDDAGPSITCAPNLTGTFKPASGNLASYNGKNMTGTWALVANDNFNGDTGTINNWQIEICAAVPQLSTPENQLTDFKIYPNPNNGSFNIQFSNSNTKSESIDVTVYDIRGRKIFSNNFSNQATFNENIQLNNPQAGIYLVTIFDGVSKIVKRIAVE
jgi:subtilisin-like proprotein convertase family protein